MQSRIQALGATDTAMVPSVNPEDEPRGDHRGVDEAEVLKDRRVADIEEAVAGEDGEDRGRETRAKGDRDGQDDDGEAERLGDADRAGGDGAQPLAGMIAVALAVEDIIDDIDKARRGAEGGGSGPGMRARRCEAP